MEARVRAPIFEYQNVFVPDGENSCNRLFVFERDPNLQGIAETLDQVPKPTSRLRGREMTAPGRDPKTIERLK
jgi:hypothetical protein